MDRRCCLKGKFASRLKLSRVRRALERNFQRRNAQSCTGSGGSEKTTSTASDSDEPQDKSLDEDRWDDMTEMDLESGRDGPTNKCWVDMNPKDKSLDEARGDDMTEMDLESGRDGPTNNCWVDMNPKDKSLDESRGDDMTETDLESSRDCPTNKCWVDMNPKDKSLDESQGDDMTETDLESSRDCPTNKCWVDMNPKDKSLDESRGDDMTETDLESSRDGSTNKCWVDMNPKDKSLDESRGDDMTETDLESSRDGSTNKCWVDMNPKDKSLDEDRWDDMTEMDLESGRDGPTNKCWVDMNPKDKSLDEARGDNMTETDLESSRDGPANKCSVDMKSKFSSPAKAQTYSVQKMKRHWRGKYVNQKKKARLQKLSDRRDCSECCEDQLEGEIMMTPTQSVEVKDDVIQKSKSVFEGRRIVELNHLGEQLKKCQNIHCSKPLLLHKVLREQQVGYASILYISCECGMENKVSTGKSHRPPDKKVGMPIYDINTKAVLGVIHSGITYRQMNGLMAVMEVKGLHHSAMARRREEIHPHIQDVARESCLAALREETQANQQPNVSSTSVSDGTFKYDMGWQKRGSGRAYNSKSGVGTLIGNETGRICAYGVRQSDCRKCQYADDKENVPQHSCAKNWTGSAKAMEPDVGIEVVRSVESAGVHVKTIIMDDDTTTMARLRSDLGHPITKWSDVNHTSKHLTNSLFSLQKKHKCLTNTVISYLKKCFNYALAQTKSDPERCKAQIEQIVPHCFGEHACCGDWCRYSNNPDQYRHQTLTKDLSGAELRDDLIAVFRVFSTNSEKIAPGGSTKDVESFNNMVASKAPKRCHFSSSSNLISRVGCAVAQKNLGNSYISSINEKVGLSPGRICKVEAARRDTERKRQKIYANESRNKLRKLQIKLKKRMDQNTKEKREGTTYQSSVATTSDILTDCEIPLPVFPPKQEGVLCENVVFCDIETGSLSKDCDILQIAACANGKTFCEYVLPSKAISPAASRVTGLTAQGGVLFLNGTPQVALPLKEALQSFIEWLSSIGSVVLVGHNFKIFDLPRIVRAIQIVGLEAEFQGVCAGGVDTLPIFKEIYPEKTKYTQEFLVREILNETYSAHNALDDVLSLQKLFCVSSISSDTLLRNSFKTEWAFEFHKYQEQKAGNYATLCNLVTDKVMSQQTAKNIAGSGLRYQHLVTVYQRGGDAALTQLLSERTCGLPRVKVSRKALESISNYFRKAGSN